MTFLTNLGFTGILCSFRLVPERTPGKEIPPKSSKLEFLEKFFANSFASSEEGNMFEALNKGGTADLPLLRTLLVIHQKSQEPSFWEVIASFGLLE